MSDPLDKYGGVPADDDDPLAKYGEDDDASTGEAPPIVMNREPTPPAPQAPKPRIPNAPQVSQSETALTELQQGSSFELADEAKAGTRALDNWLRSKGAGGVARHVPIVGPALEMLGAGGPRVPETAGRGMNAPIKGYDDYLREYAARRAAGKEQNPKTAVAANLTGAVASGMLVPPVKAAQGAGMLPRLGAGAANVAVDTAIGAGTAAAGAAPGDRAEAALKAAPVAAGLSTALRAAPALVKGTYGLAKKSALSTLPEDVRPAAETLTEMTPQGAAARAAARAGQRDLDPTTRAITKTLSEGEEFSDAILDYAKVGMKRAPIVKAMAAEAIDPQKAVMSTGGTVERIAMELDELAAKPAGSMEVSGRQAVDYARTAFDNAREELIEALGRTGEQGGDAAADLFMRVDNLKRQVGKAVKRSGSGTAADQMVYEKLMDHYGQLRELLENESVWGKGASTVQREVNAAWTPWLTKRRAFEKGFLAEDALDRGASGWNPLPVADPAKVGGVLENAGRAKNDLKERILQEGLQSNADLTSTLAKHYDAPPEIVDKAASVAKGSNEILDTFGKTREELVKARELRDVSAAAPSVPLVPKLGSAINAVSALEEVAPGVIPAAQAVGKLAEPARKVVAANTGRASAEAETVQSSELATQDPVYGSSLATRKGDDRNTAYMVLMKTDPDFRARQEERRKRVREQQEQQEQ